MLFLTAKQFTFISMMKKQQKLLVQQQVTQHTHVLAVIHISVMKLQLLDTLTIMQVSLRAQHVQRMLNLKSDVKHAKSLSSTVQMKKLTHILKRILGLLLKLLDTTLQFLMLQLPHVQKQVLQQAKAAQDATIRLNRQLLTHSVIQSLLTKQKLPHVQKQVSQRANIAQYATIRLNRQLLTHSVTTSQKVSAPFVAQQIPNTTYTKTQVLMLSVMTAANTSFPHHPSNLKCISTTRREHTTSRAL